VGRSNKQKNTKIENKIYERRKQT